MMNNGEGMVPFNQVDKEAYNRDEKELGSKTTLDIPAEKRHYRICGLQRRVVAAILAALLAILGLTVGLVVGIGQKNH